MERVLGSFSGIGALLSLIGALATAILLVCQNEAWATFVGLPTLACTVTFVSATIAVHVLTGRRVRPVVKAVNEQLATRKFELKEVWGGDRKRLKAVVCLCEAIQSEMQWHSSTFLPDDPCEIVLFDCDDVGAIVLPLEELWGVTLDVWKCLPRQLEAANLGEVVDTLLRFRDN